MIAPISGRRSWIAEEAKGWLHPDEGPFLRQVAAGCPGPYLEVGSYCGKSAVWLGDAAEAAGTVLFSIDHHQGSPEMAQGSDCFDLAVIAADGAHDSLGLFRATMRAAGLHDVVLPVVASTGAIGPYWSTPVGFVFIDGAHDYAGCKLDADTWVPWVKPGGYIAFHDTTIPDIARVVDDLTDTTGFAEVDGCGTVRVIRCPG